jgi:hypothetical protein
LTFEYPQMCPDNTATAGSWAGVGLVNYTLGQLRFGFVAVLVGQIVYSEKLISSNFFKTRTATSYLRTIHRLHWL